MKVAEYAALMRLARGHNVVTPVRLESAALPCRVKRSTTELPTADDPGKPRKQFIT